MEVKQAETSRPLVPDSSRWRWWNQLKRDKEKRDPLLKEAVDVERERVGNQQQLSMVRNDVYMLTKNIHFAFSFVPLMRKVVPT